MLLYLPAYFSGWIGTESFYASRYPVLKEPDNELAPEEMFPASPLQR
jgi:hypothetical protein